ncbi:SAM-dependent methyltransferase [Pseudonocardia sp. TRM90224]|uniref:SAM-dependent methyltransferase n=1 Tax=Pseudonocardia sp. TRM90224 TaxID=2812678 RepID=UPI001E388C2D|nr:SAM-dependent methyltransferase [Pseudonocardia sp. TRM90224]
MTEPAEQLASTASAPPADAVIDTETPAISRVYDYLLGGKHHYDVDRIACNAMIQAVPETPLLALANRAFVRRAVQYLVGEAGIRQFIDIGSGLPATGNVHEVAEQLNPNVRVVYVDKDPIVLAYGRALLSKSDNTTVITADLRDPDAIFEQPEVHRLIDTSEPFAILLGGVMMHLEPHEDPVGVAARLRAQLPSGGYLMHCGCSDPGDDPRAPELNAIFEQFHMGSRTFPTYPEQLRYFEGLDLVEPGFVPANTWRAGLDFPDPDNPAHAMLAGGIGRKP